MVRATLSCSKPEGLEVFFRSITLNETIVISFKEHITPKKYLDGVDDEQILKYEIYVFDQIGFEKTQLTKTKYTRVVSYRFMSICKPQINSMQTNYALVDHMRTLTDFKSDTTIITDLNSI